jgi:hypothetical protein
MMDPFNTSRGKEKKEEGKFEEEEQKPKNVVNPTPLSQHRIEYFPTMLQILL